MTKIKTTVVEFDQFADIDFVPPANYYVRTALYYLYLHTQDRAKAQAEVDEIFGKGKYLVKASKLTKSKPKYDGFSITAR